MTRRARITWKVLLILAVVYIPLSWSWPSYRYTSSDGGFRSFEVPFKGRHLDAVTREFDKYRQNGHPDAVLMRTFDRNWWHPNLWRENLTHERWQLPRAPTKPEPGK